MKKSLIWSVPGKRNGLLRATVDRRRLDLDGTPQGCRRRSSSATREKEWIAACHCFDRRRLDLDGTPQGCRRRSSSATREKEWIAACHCSAAAALT